MQNKLQHTQISPALVIVFTDGQKQATVFIISLVRIAMIIWAAALFINKTRHTTEIVYRAMIDHNVYFKLVSIICVSVMWGFAN